MFMVIKKIIKKIDNISMNCLCKLILIIIVKSKSLSSNLSSSKRIIVDCSNLYTSDMNTGIQRVTRNIITNLKLCIDSDISIIPASLENNLIINVENYIFNSSKDNNVVVSSNFKLVTYLRKRLRRITLCFTLRDKLVVPTEKDIVILIDASWGNQIWESLENIRKSRSTIITVIYDLIPIDYPQFVNNEFSSAFQNWIEKTLIYSSGYISISETVKNNLIQYLQSKGIAIDDFLFNYWRLGSDFTSSKVHKLNSPVYQKAFTGGVTYLTVSYIQPRKNHTFVLDAFDELWKKGIDVVYCIVGKIDKKMDFLSSRIKLHPEYNKRLFLLDNVSDEELAYCYQNSKALIFPSIVEGFGLPILESLKSGLSVLASDTPIHHEVGKDMIEYFSLEDPRDLIQMIENIESGTRQLKKVDSENIHITTWKESAEEFLQKVLEMVHR